MKIQLPQPLPEQLTISQKLTQVIAKTIEQQQGFISFADYMNIALYEPGLGYYTAGQQKFGQAGDFVTAPEISSVFGQCLANAFIDDLPGKNMLEFGAGSGKLAIDILQYLHNQNALPNHYYILETSAELRDRQQQQLREHCPFYSHVIWLDELPENFSGIVIANEVLDAMPIERFEIRGDKILQLGVTIEDGSFGWTSREADGELQAMVQNLSIPGLQHTTRNDETAGAPRTSSSAAPYGHEPPKNRRVLPSPEDKAHQNYQSEISLIIPAWLQSIKDMIVEGKVFLIDYGFLAHEFYHPQRHMGTLMCHYRHHAHPDPFYYPGLQDITAHVNFTQVAETAEQLGFEVEFDTQANFLLANGLIELVQSIPQDEVTRVNTNQAIKQLTHPHEMGELFKVIALL